MFKNIRESGILLHISSLPSPYGIGTLGREAYEFIDFLKSVGMKVWQVLPLNVVSFGNSPYQSPSSIALNPYFIDLRILKDKGLLTQNEIDQFDKYSNPSKVDYDYLFKTRIPLLKKAFNRFDINDPEFLKFASNETYQDCCFYLALKETHNYKPWNEFKDCYRNYSPEIQELFIKENYDLYNFYLWTQFEFLNQYKGLKDYANKNGISILGDMPIYLAYDSIEVYKHPEMFLLDKDKNPTLVAGCPPDCFTADGQLWGNPIYDWKYLKSKNYEWFNNRIKYNLDLFDYLRIDHFIGFASYYAVPFKDKTARNGHRELGPGMDLFKDKLDWNIVAEDLGYLDDTIKKFIKDTNYPGMKNLIFAFDGDKNNMHLPSNSNENSICYTGTHDNMPLLAYLQDLNKDELETYKKSLRIEMKKFNVNALTDTLKDLVLATDQLAFASPSGMCILPFQDLIVSGRETRMNSPSIIGDNWEYRATKSDFTESLSNFIKRSNTRFNR